MSVMINGKQFDWGDITISLLPLTPVVFTAKSISWDEELEAEAVYGKGRVPVGYGKGNWKASGKLEMLKSEFEALALIAPSGILNLDPRITTINVLYSNSFDSLIPISANTLMGIRFTKLADSASQGDKELKVSLDFLILGDIKRNGKSTRGIIALN
ncbi:MAG: hypothetical protein ACRC0X_09400 [Brevinema sp.]